VKPEALLFDMDGLMVDTEPLYWDVARRMAVARGKVCGDETLRRMMGISRHDSMAVYKAELGLAESVEELLEEREGMMLERYAKGVEPLAGLREILGRFAGRLRMAVVTSSPRKFTGVLLPGMGVEKFFEHVQTGDGIRRGKPDPEIYLAALGVMGLGGERAVVLEDTRAGASAGHAAGCRVIAVPTHLTAEQDFSFCHARVGSLFEAADVIEALSR
jgi:HAD superfamily hydrolase (TIGR01509 family)